MVLVTDKTESSFILELVSEFTSSTKNYIIKMSMRNAIWCKCDFFQGRFKTVLKKFIERFLISMKLFSVILGAVLAAKNEECPANSEGAAERCESACQESYIGTILVKPNSFSQIIN